MRKAVIVFVLLLLPSVLFAQETLRVTSIVGPVEWKAASGRAFTTLSNQVIRTGDELRTGPGGSVVVHLPDSSYMVVSENSRVVLDDIWSGNFKSIMNLMLGQVRFYIQRLGGRPNPYSVRTPTALIAVRGTTFDVFVDDAQVAEVRCLEGRITVESTATNREVILEPGFRTLVRPGDAAPAMPVRNDAELNRGRILTIQKKDAPEIGPNGVPSMEALGRDNDRRNRSTDPQGTNSRMNTNTQRAKGTLSFP
jgi:hypothetical protein